MESCRAGELESWRAKEPESLESQSPIMILLSGHPFMRQPLTWECEGGWARMLKEGWILEPMGVKPAGGSGPVKLGKL